MKFLVVGHLCLDVIHPVEGPDVENYGGVYYSVAALASLAKPSDIVSPVFGVNKASNCNSTAELRKPTEGEELKLSIKRHA